jgi:Zn-dependent protease with chaperone function
MHQPAHIQEERPEEPVVCPWTLTAAWMPPLLISNIRTSFRVLTNAAERIQSRVPLSNALCGNSSSYLPSLLGGFPSLPLFVLCSLFIFIYLFIYLFNSNKNADRVKQDILPMEELVLAEVESEVTINRHKEVVEVLEAAVVVAVARRRQVAMLLQV